MKKRIFFIFMLYATILKAQDQKVFKVIEIYKHNVFIVFVDSSNRCYKKVYFKRLKGNEEGFWFCNKKIYSNLPVKNDSVLHYIKDHFVYPSSPPGVMPIVYIAFIIDEAGTIIAKGLQRGSADKEFSDQMLSIISSIEFKFPPGTLNGRPVAYLYLQRINFLEIEK